MSVVINVVGQFDGKQLDRAQRELDKLGRNVKGQESQVRSMGRSFKAAGGLVAAAVGGQMVGSVVQFGLRMEELSREAETTQRKFDVVFGEMADDMRVWADEQNEAFGVSETAMQAFAASVQDILIPLGFARDTASGMTQEVLTLANALTEFTPGTTTEQAVGALTAGLTGEREQLKQFGIVLKDADIKARLAEKGLEGLTGEALKQETAIASLELAYELGADALAAYEDRAGTATAEMKELNAELADAEQTLADALAPEVGYVRGQLVELAGSAGDTAAAISGTTDESQSLLEALADFSIVEAFFGDMWEDGVPKMDAWGATVDDITENVEDLEGAAESSGDEFDAYYAVAGEVEDALAEMGDQADYSSRQIENLADETRSSGQAMLDALNPVKQLRDANQEFEDALVNLQTVQGDADASAGDLEQAQWDLLEAYGQVQAAQDEFSTAGVTDDMYALASAVGFTEEQLRALISGFASMDGATVTPQSTPSGGISVDATGWSLQAFDTGGVVKGPLGSPQLVVAHGGETILPTHQPGWSMDGSGQPVQVNLMLDGQVLASKVLNELTVMERRGTIRRF